MKIGPLALNGKVTAVTNNVGEAEFTQLGSSKGRPITPNDTPIAKRLQKRLLAHTTERLRSAGLLVAVCNWDILIECDMGGTNQKVHERDYSVTFTNPEGTSITLTRILLDGDCKPAVSHEFVINE